MTVASNEARAVGPRTGTAKSSTRPTERAEREFESTFFEHYPRVYGVLFRLVGDRAEAEDLALETFWRLWERAPKAEETFRVGGWLYRVAVRLGYNALRAARRRAKYEEIAGRDMLDALDADGPPDPAHAAEQSDERASVREVLERLSARHARLLILRHSGLSYQEIAAALEIAPSSVGTLLARAEKEFERRFAVNAHT